MRASSDKQQSWREDNCVCGPCASPSSLAQEAAAASPRLRGAVFHPSRWQPHSCHSRRMLATAASLYSRLCFFFFFLFVPSHPLFPRNVFGNCFFFFLFFFFFFASINSATRMNTARQSKQCSPWVPSNLSQCSSVSQQAPCSFCQHHYCCSWWWWSWGWWWGWGWW